MFCYRYHHKNLQAFSLVELSIVLVVLGLLVGGILGGKSLIRASELRSITTQFQNFSAAHNAFRDKYFAVAGDMANATQFWGAASAVSDVACADALEAGVTGTLTCNGEGNGFVQRHGPDRAEKVLYWHHLANAGLIEGSYTGYSHVSPASCCFDSTANSGRGKIPQSIWLAYSNNNAPFKYWFGKQRAPFGGMPASAGGENILIPEEVWNIDTKLDDGKPNTGKIVAFDSAAGTNCAVGSLPTDDYKLDYTSIACFFGIIVGR